MNGRTFKIEDGRIGVNLPPLHPNCRCSVASHIDDDEFINWLEDHGVELTDQDLEEMGSERKDKLTNTNSRDTNDASNRHNASNKTESKVVNKTSPHFYVGLNGKALLAKYKHWIGDNRMEELLSKASSLTTKRYIRTAYRRKSFIGDGGTYDIRRFEIATGLECGRKGSYKIKVKDLIKQIEKALLQDLPENDRLYLEEELRKLKEVDE